MPHRTMFKQMNKIVLFSVLAVLVATFSSCHVGTALASPAISKELTIQNQNTKTWHTVETWTIAAKTEGDNPSPADLRKTLSEPSQADGYRLGIGDQRTKKRRVKKIHKLKQLLGLTFVTALWSDLFILPKCILLACG
jgi:hypothetical protein